METGQPQITGIFLAPVRKQLLIGIIVPVEIDGERRYVPRKIPRSERSSPPGCNKQTTDRLAGSNLRHYASHYCEIRPAGSVRRAGAFAGAVAWRRPR
jgi:hypothetical protein